MGLMTRVSGAGARAIRWAAPTRRAAARPVRLSLRTLLLGLTGLALLGVTSGDLALTVRERGHAAEERMLAETRLLMAAGRPLLLSALVVGDLATAEQTLRELNAHLVWRHVVLYEPDGLRVMLDASPPSPADTRVPALLRWALSIDTLQQRTPIAAGPVVHAILAVTPSPERHENNVWSEVRSLVIGQAVAFALLLVLLNFVLARGLRPVRALADSAERFGGGDLSTRMPHSRFVEIEPTVRAFNTMASNLQQREGERQAAERRQAARLAVARILIETQDLDQALVRVVEALGEILGWDRGECWLLDPEADAPRRACTWRASGSVDDPDPAETAPVLARGVGVAGRAWANERVEWSTAGGTTLAIPLSGARGVLGIMVLATDAVREPDGELLAALADTAGRIGLFLERRLSDEALGRAEEQLRQAVKMEAIGKLAGGVAHDFNNLLTVILGRCQILLRRPQEAPTREALALIDETAQRAAALTRQLLAFGRRQVLQPRPLDLNAVVDGIAPMLRRLIGEHIELSTRLAREVPPVRADLSQLEQVIVNLAVNARDAMPQSGRLTLETAVVDLDAAYVRRHEGARVGRHVQLSVSDTGAGMDAETLARIFEPFFTTKGPGQGTGLGLATVYGIVRQSGGSISVTSHPGQGSVFRICLPVLEGQAPAREEVAVTPLPRGTETVLLVEDEPAVRALAGEILQELGYTVLTAGNADEGWQVAAAYRGTIDLLFTDVVMPGASGRDLAHRLTPVRPAMKVLYMSGYTEHAIVRRGVLEPGVAYMEKPFTPDSLARRLRAVLDP
jgi:signal transduction histidine kinase/CheY-like chemotaxis protein